MAEDRQTDKTTRWAITVYQEQYSLFDVMDTRIAEWGWQTEMCPTTGKEHRQGFIRTKTQQRFGAMRKMFPGVHIEVAMNWGALINYCKKTETAVPGSQVHQHGTVAMSMATALTRLAGYEGLPRSELVPIVVEGDVKSVVSEVANYLTRDYWHRVNKLLADDPDTISLWTNVSYLNAWKNTRQVWLDRHESEP